MTKAVVLEAITCHYLDSDFNGLPASEAATPVVHVRELIQEGLVSLCRGDNHPNPHIKAYEPEAIEVQLGKIDRDGLAGCLYPEPAHLERTLDRAPFADRPFTLRLKLGQPQLSYLSFDLAVLEHYRNDPRYYFDVNDVNGSIGLNENAQGAEPRHQSFLQSFGFSYDREMNRSVAVFLRYLHDLSPEHQRIWDAQRLDGERLLHPDYAASSAGHWPEMISLPEAIIEEYRMINEMCDRMGRPHFFREDYRDGRRPRELGFLLRPTLQEYNNSVHLLDRMISENINLDFFGNDVPREDEVQRPDGRIEVHRRGSIRILEEWWKNYVRLEDAAFRDKMIGVIKDIRKQRQQPAHAINENVFDQAYFKRQRELMMKAYGVVRYIRQVLGLHPSNADYEVPEFLQDGQKIRNF